MFEVGWSEMLVIAIVMIVVVGPKDLPAMLRTFGRTVAKLRGMAGDFQKQFNDALKEAELDDVKKSVDSLRSLNPMNEIRKQLNPFEQAAADVRSGVDDVMKPKPAAAATPDASATEPAANSTPATPVAGAPEPMPASPTFPAMTDASVVADPMPAAPTKPAKTAAARPAKAAAAKATVAKAAAAPKAAAKPAPKAAKPAAAKPEAKPAVTAAKKPAAARKKTAGTAK